MQVDDVWYLGIDFGTTGISAVLLNAIADEQYPIYWTFPTSPEKNQSTFRLPTITYCEILPATHLEQVDLSLVPAADLASKKAQNQSGIWIEKFKSYLNMAIPYYCEQEHHWQPILQWSNQQEIPLNWMQQGLQVLLSTLTPSNQTKNNSIEIGAVGLSPENLHSVLHRLSGVILGHPANWEDAYRFNLREAVLGAGLAKRAEQVLFIEDAIASFLSWLDQYQHSDLITQPLTGSTLIINAGAYSTELALVTLPTHLENLSHNDFVMRSFPYGGNFLDQDIICQMLFKDETGNINDELASPSSVDALQNLPLPGEINLEFRDRLQQLLHSSPLGQALLEAARYLKLTLQRQEEFTLEIGSQKYVCTNRELKQRVIEPFFSQLNRELNLLLSQTKLFASDITHVICTGGTSSLDLMAGWLKNKFFNATLVQDKYKDGGLKTCSRVAHGLASLPLYPQVLERQSQQYSNYFLVLELLRNLPRQPMTAEEIMQLLDRRGVNTRACQERLMQLLTGELPPGLVPASTDWVWLTQASQHNQEYQAIAATSLFEQKAERVYALNPEKSQLLLDYLNKILSRTHQKLAEPLIVDI